MDSIITDGEKYETSKKVADLLRSIFIKQYESEPIISIKTKLKNAMELSKGTSICC